MTLDSVGYQEWVNSSFADIAAVWTGSGVTTFAQAQANMTQVGVYTVLTLGADQVYIYNVQPFHLTADNFLFL